jgi:hypothetical protein
MFLKSTLSLAPQTIEFALGTVSNTASYLRLWALSLAHGQLADVFFDKLLASMALSGSGNPILLFILFPIFASFSFFVLMCMDSMECFLHTLRLHWVEFQNKFYQGNGYKFVPFSFRQTLLPEIERIDLDEIDEKDIAIPDEDDSQELKPTLKELKKKDQKDKKDEEEKKKKEEEDKEKEEEKDRKKKEEEEMLQPSSSLLS